MRRAFLLALLTLLLPQVARAEVPSCKDIVTSHDGDGEPGWYMEGAVPGAIYVVGDGIADLDMFIDLIAKSPGRVIIIEGGRFEDWDFSIVGSPIRSVCFHNSLLARTTWHRGDYPGMGFVDSDLTGSNFRDAHLPDVLLQNVLLENATMAGARLDRGLYLAGWYHNADRWDLSGASLRDFRFICGIEIFDGCPPGPSGISLARADLAGADISQYHDWSDTDFEGALLNATVIAPRQIPLLVLGEVTGGVVLRGGAYRITITDEELRELQHEAGEFASDSAGPSFPCHRASSKAELIICDEFEAALRHRDLEMAWLYGRVREGDPGEAARQKAWLVRRDHCEDADCIRHAYARRIDQLSAILGPSDPAYGREAAYYMRETLPLSREFRSGALYSKVLPALVGDADIGAVVRRDGAGNYQIAGKAMGANGHVCTVLGGGLAFDSATGWFSITEEGTPQPLRIFQLIDQTLHIVGDGHPEFDRGAPDSSYVSCGMRASFVPMTRIEMEPAQLAAMMRFFEF